MWFIICQYIHVLQILYIQLQTCICTVHCIQILSSDTVQFTGILYPSGLQENDIISQFYFTRITLQGTSGTKNPKVIVDVEAVYGYGDKLTLIVRDSTETIVHTGFILTFSRISEYKSGAILG